MQIQYLGFQPKARGREYSYLVIDAKSEKREFTFRISNQALVEKRVRYQDAAAMCYRKLQKALETETDAQPLPRHCMVSDQELDEYRESSGSSRR